MKWCVRACSAAACLLVQRVMPIAKHIRVIIVAFFCSALGLCFAGTSLYQDSKASIETRIRDLLSRLTLEEKVSLCYGNFTSGGVPRLGIAPLQMRDGRQGVRPVKEERGTSTTLLPCALALSCTWDLDATREFGRVLAEEMLALNEHVLLAPNLNLVRTPLGGRNFEDFGEDPCLVGRIATAYIESLQEKGVGACSCLMVANDCEKRRHFTSSNMGERTLRELHLRGYELSVRDAHVWTMMTGNNLLNGTYCSQNHHLLQELVKDDFGFDGVMITDWRAAYETTPTALAGTDMTTGFCSYVFGSGHLLDAVQRGEVPQSLLDEKVRRILRLYIRCGVLDPGLREKGSLNTAEHRDLARRIAAEGMVLLKNENHLLPLDPAKLHRVLVTGPAAVRVLQGGGSGGVPAAASVSALQGLRSAFGDKVEVVHVAYPAQLKTRADKGSTEWENTASQKPVSPKRSAPKPQDAVDSTTLIQAAKSAQAVIFVAAGLLGSEGNDLPTMDLPAGQAEAIAALTTATPPVIVVLVSNGAVSLDGWGERVPALLAIHYSGQETGDALADVLTGKVCPSGKLSYTFARQLKDYACHALGEWPARLILDKDPIDPGMTPETRKPRHAFDADYKEGVFSGYRWFDEKKIEPRYPFGYGLSYTTFELKNMTTSGTVDSGYQVSCSVKNTGAREGAEVVQLYVAPQKSAVARPMKELKSFARVNLKPGESGVVSIWLPADAFRYYDEPSKRWKADAGEYELQLGTSSRQIQLRTKVKMVK